MASPPAAPQAASRPRGSARGEHGRPAERQREVHGHGGGDQRQRARLAPQDERAGGPAALEHVGARTSAHAVDGAPPATAASAPATSTSPTSGLRATGSPG